MDEIIAFFGKNPLIIAIVNVITFIGFLVTVYVSFKVREINNFYTFKIRVPEHIKKLKTFASEISGYMNDYEGAIDQIDLALVKIEAESKSLKRKLNIIDAQSIYRLLKEIKNYSKRDNKDLPHLREIYLNLSKTIAQIENLQKDKNSEKK